VGESASLALWGIGAPASGYEDFSLWGEDPKDNNDWRL